METNDKKKYNCAKPEFPCGDIRNYLEDYPHLQEQLNIAQERFIKREYEKRYGTYI